MTDQQQLEIDRLRNTLTTYVQMMEATSILILENNRLKQSNDNLKLANQQLTDIIGQFKEDKEE